MAVDLETGLYLLAAAIVAIVIRLYDSPKTSIIADGKIQWGNILPTVIGALMAAPLGAWLLGLDVMTPTGFAAIVGVAIGGLSLIKALLNIKDAAAE